MYLCYIIVDAQPTERELPVWSRVESVLKYANSILYELHQYKGASNEIRDVSSFTHEFAYIAIQICFDFRNLVLTNTFCNGLTPT